MAKCLVPGPPGPRASAFSPAVQEEDAHCPGNPDEEARLLSHASQLICVPHRDASVLAGTDEGSVGRMSEIQMVPGLPGTCVPHPPQVELRESRDLSRRGGPGSSPWEAQDPDRRQRTLPHQGVCVRSKCPCNVLAEDTKRGQGPGRRGHLGVPGSMRSQTKSWSSTTTPILCHLPTWFSLPRETVSTPCEPLVPKRLCVLLPLPGVIPLPPGGCPLGLLLCEG